MKGNEIRARVFSVIVALLLVAPWLPASGAPQTADSTAPQAKTEAPAKTTDFASLEAYGSPSAPITMEVFSDYQCPYCKAFFNGGLPPVMQNYVNAGKVYYIHRNFPLHNHAAEAAHWAASAAIAGIFPEVEKALFATQDTWGANGKIGDSLASVLPPADMKKLQAIQSQPNPQIDAYVAHDKALGVSHGVDQQGTPSIVVTRKGKSVLLPPNGVEYSLLKAYLDSLLARR